MFHLSFFLITTSFLIGRCLPYFTVKQSLEGKTYHFVHRTPNEEKRNKVCFHSICRPQTEVVAEDGKLSRHKHTVAIVSVCKNVKQS